MSVQDVTDAAFAADVLERSKTTPVVVDFWATWCGPCRQLSPTIERVADDFRDTVVALKMDVDANPQTAGMLGIQSIPTVVAFKDGKPVDAFLGAQPENMVRDFFARLAPSEDDRVVEETAALPDDEAEPVLRGVLSRDPGHRGAVLRLAAIVGMRGETAEAKALLARIPEDEDVRRVAAQVEMASVSSADLGSLAAAAASDVTARIEYGRALAAAGRHAEALEQLMSAFHDGERDPAREAMLDVFALLGDADPLVVRYRRELASALF
ncbi:MAG TPA: thioredoxin [Actinomycetota bacterium]|nr:thioredoxin [Actinomycetota bacterium]